MRPRDAKKFVDLCQLTTDGWDEGKGYWLQLDEKVLTIAAQELGHEPTAKITLSRAVFDKMVDWYLRDQPEGA